ncbi:hypothetical protein NKI41_20380 [Mesorhizobium sp. M0601]|uniref:hypothetical protein n=1 Tax=Mesorhizobium sp. M0601 TaxID=2956969 RepID=UPI003336EA83
MPALTTRPAPVARTARRLLNSLVAAVVLIAAAIPFAASALAHDAKPTAAMPQGWSYPFSCCSGYDCREVSQTSISERPEGYVIKGTGEVVAYSDKRIKNSPDGEYHWCSVAGANDGKTICLFVPPSSY